MDYKATHLSNTENIKLNSLQVLNSLFKVAYENMLPIACWKLPKKDEFHCIISLSIETESHNLELEELNPGFIFNAFDPNHPGGMNFINSDIYYNSTLKTLTINKKFGKGNIRLEKVLERFEHLLTNEELEVLHNTGYHISDLECSSTKEEEYTAGIKRAIEFINDGKAIKVVPSKIKVLDIKKFDLTQNFKKLCEVYTNALVSLVSIPDRGTWLGASPEVLISVDKDKNFHTVALAGTQPYNEEIKLSEVAWKQKEIEEQAMVSRYIINCFKKIRLRDFEEVGPKTAIAGNLLHLKTDFEVDMIATEFPKLGSVMLKLLHPTSAVCGMPKEPAMEFLLSNEKHQRSFFSGYLGPVNINKEINIFVNLRCMQLTKNRAILYAGAGVTADSIPEKEWNETEIKCKTLLSVINL
jgi:isochorismate synthase